MGMRIDTEHIRPHTAKIHLSDFTEIINLATSTKYYNLNHLYI